MKLITLTNNTGSSSRAGWHVRDLRRAAVDAGHTFLACSWRSLQAHVGDGPIASAGDVVLDDADAVLLRTMPPGTLEQVVFRMDAVGRLAAAGKPVINPPRAIEAAVDKYLSLARLRDAGLPVPRTAVCQRVSDAMEAFEQLGGDVIVKPMFGSEGMGMTRVTDTQLARRAFQLLERMSSTIYLQQTIDHDGSDVRVFVLGGEATAAMRRRGEGWKTNIAAGATAEPMDVDPALRDLALRAAAACDTLVAGVDILFDRDSRPWVLEVNGVPGWRALSAVTGFDIGAMVIDFVASRAKAASHA